MTLAMALAFGNCVPFRKTAKVSLSANNMKKNDNVFYEGEYA